MAILGFINTILTTIKRQKKGLADKTGNNLNSIKRKRKINCGTFIKWNMA